MSFRFQYARRGLSYFYNTAIPGGSDQLVNIPGFAYFGREPYSYIQRVEQRYQFHRQFFMDHGRHDTKFGVDFNYIPTTATFTVNYGGVYDISAVAAFQHRFPCLILSRLTVRACPATSFRESVTRMTRFPTSRWSFFGRTRGGSSELPL